MNDKSYIMSTKHTPEFAEIIESPNYIPCISFIMPFEPKMNPKKELAHQIKTGRDKIEQELISNFPKELTDATLKKMDLLLKDINFNTHKKSIAIFVSPLMQKVYYLDIHVDERIVIDDSFEIRDLIHNKKEVYRYLLAVLSGKSAKVYICTNDSFSQVILSQPNHIEAYKNEIAEKVANFSDANKRKEILLDKFLRHTDNGISLLLQAYKLPLFIMGTSRTIGHFKSITHNEKMIVETIHGNFEEKTHIELQRLMQPYIKDWKNLKQQELLKQIDEAFGNKKLTYGIQDVWKVAAQKRGRLLIVEKNYTYAANKTKNDEIFSRIETSLKNAFYIKDAVDDVIEKVLESGGNVEFVEEGSLADYQKIVLIEYYGNY